MTSTAANVLSMWIIGILGVSINHTAASELVYENIAIVLPKQLRVLPPRQAYLAACVVAKDVHPDDAIEWLVHHAALGVGHVYWYAVCAHIQCTYTVCNTIPSQIKHQV